MTIESENLKTDSGTECLKMNGQEENGQNVKLPETINDKDEPNEMDEKPEWEDLLGSGGILKKVLKEGQTDSRPQRLERCTINLECALEDGTVVEKRENFELLLGDCEVVQGLDLSLGLMNVGEKCVLKLEDRLGYGAKGDPPKIPPKSTLVYTVELLKVEPEFELESLSIAERKFQGNKKRERGNWWYGRGENTLAVQCYRRALDFLDEVEGGIKFAESDNTPTDAALQELLEDRMSVSNNMAAAQIKLELYDAALNSLQTVLRCQPGNVKALYRKAKIYREKNDLTAALKTLQKANDASPNNADVQKEISILNSLIQKQKISERELARRMFSGAKGENKKKKDSSKMYVWATVGVSLVVGLVGLAAYRFKITV